MNNGSSQNNKNNHESIKAITTRATTTTMTANRREQLNCSGYQSNHQCGTPCMSGLQSPKNLGSILDTILPDTAWYFWYCTVKMSDLSPRTAAFYRAVEIEFGDERIVTPPLKKKKRTRKGVERRRTWTHGKRRFENTREAEAGRR